ncbi:MAG TPA: hypothetical protein VF111_15130 [Thermoanaerobaculia bacterium]
MAVSTRSAGARASTAAPKPPAPVTAPPPGATMAIFRYDGGTSLTVWGRVTTKKYWFAGPGSEVAIDLRDRASMRQVPHLREVRLE